VKAFLLEKEKAFRFVGENFEVIGIIIEEDWNKAAAVACAQYDLKVKERPELEKNNDPFIYRIREVPLINLPG